MRAALHPGAAFAISPMAAAGLGNLLSDVAGVGLSNKIEELAESLGFQMPELTRAGGLLRTSTRPTSNLLLLLIHASV